MQIERLPRTVNPAKLAQRRIELRGEIPLSDLDRLCQQLLGSEGQVALQLDFGSDKQGFTTIIGSVSAKVGVTCQRCMDKLMLDVTAKINLALVADDEAANELPDRYEPIMAEDKGFLPLRALIEDDLILALPIIAYHETACGFVDEDSKEIDIEVSKENPFSVLEVLKH